MSSPQRVLFTESNDGHGLDWIYDVKNSYEMGVNFCLFALNIFLVVLISLNMMRIRSWSKKEEVNEGKLMCINTNNLCVCVVRLIYGSSVIYWACTGYNYHICLYFLFQSLSYFWMNLLYIIVTFHWTKFYLSLKYKRTECKSKVGMLGVRFIIYLIIVLALISILMLIVTDGIADDPRINDYFKSIRVMIGSTSILSGFSFVYLSCMTLRYLKRFFEGTNSAMSKVWIMTVIVIPCVLYRVFYNFTSAFENNFFKEWRKQEDNTSWAFGFELSYFLLTDIFPSIYLVYLYSPNMKPKTNISPDDVSPSRDDVFGQRASSQDYFINKEY